MRVARILVGLVAALIACLVITAPVQAFNFTVLGDGHIHSSSDDNDPDSFAVGSLDFFIQEDIDDKTRVFAEILLENTGSGFAVDIERLYITRAINDVFNVRLGRFHAPLGYWNKAYHHGLLIQDTFSRPEFLEFEDDDEAIMPMHLIGLGADGVFANGLSYEVVLANSSFLDSQDSSAEFGLSNSKDLSNDKTIAGRLVYAQPGSALEFGVSAMLNPVAEAGSSGSSVPRGSKLLDQTIVGFDMRYHYEKLNVLAEYFRISNDPVQAAISGGNDAKSHDADAYYLQFTYQLNDTQRLSYRYESLSFDQGKDLLFNIRSSGARQYSANVVTLRHELDDSNALYLDWKRADPQGDNSEDTIILAWAFLIL